MELNKDYTEFLQLNPQALKRQKDIHDVLLLGGNELISLSLLIDIIYSLPQQHYP